VFIKWRTYLRQLNGIEGDKYIEELIIVKSFRVGEKGLLRELSKKKADHLLSCIHHEKVMPSRHEAIGDLPSYPVCMVISSPPPEFMKQRSQWWERVDSLIAQMVEKWPDTMNEETVGKLKADIEKVVPKVTGAKLEKLSVVQNDLPPHL
jgi:hypothetical protein